MRCWKDGKQAVLDMKAALDEAGVVGQDAALRQAAGQAFYNASRSSPCAISAPARSRQQLEVGLRGVLARRLLPQRAGHPRQLRVPQPDPAPLPKADALGTLIEKLTSPDINLSPYPVMNADGADPPSRPRQSRHGHRSSRSWCAASTRRTTRRRASTGPRATPCG